MLSKFFAIILANILILRLFLKNYYKVCQAEKKITDFKIIIMQYDIYYKDRRNSFHQLNYYHSLCHFLFFILLFYIYDSHKSSFIRVSVINSAN